MKLPGYYSSGQFARMANVSVRTIRFYDKQNILHPSYVTPSLQVLYRPGFCPSPTNPAFKIPWIFAGRHTRNDDQ